MSVLSRVEAAFEAVFEGSFRRIFSPRLQPIEVAHALARTMLNEKAVGPNTIDVPNQYVARVNPVDFDQFAPARAAHERNLAAYVDRRAEEEGFRPLGRIQVELKPDPTVPRSFVRVDARWDQPPEDAGTVEIDKTRRFEPVDSPQSMPALRIRAEDGQETRVQRAPVRIGRGPDNDVVIRDIRVSRYHAAIERTAVGWVVRDLQSTNGTFHDGERVDEVEVAGSTELSLGGFRITIDPG